MAEPLYPPDYGVRKATDPIDFSEWMAPTTEDKATDAWLERLGAYLMAQMQQGFVSEAEADLIWDDMVGRLTGQGKYEGVKHTVLDLPSTILNDVENYWKSLPIEAQKAIDQQAREAQQQAQDIAQQRGQLPLDAGGTQEQQFNAGMTAINTLKQQMAAAPDYLQAEMRGQILNLEESLNQIRGNIRLDASRGTWEGESLPRSEILKRQAERAKEEESKEPLEISRKFAEKYGMSPEAAQRTGYNYIDNPDSPEYANLTKEEKLDLEWVGLRAHEDTQRKEPAKPVAKPGFEGISTQGSQQWRSWFERNYPSIVSEFKQKPAEAQTSSGWDEFLKQERTRIKEGYLKQSPYNRGERPAAYAPKIKTVAF
uniref:Uncharacterized protein n=1 Tax=viral metagenome TaxID=1070528 RepID=A0A6M3IP85_9ZZZZ